MKKTSKGFFVVLASLVVILPCQAAVQTDCKLYHVVKKGESLSSIAAIHNTSSLKLSKINNITDKNDIKYGKKLCVNNDVEQCAAYHVVKKGDTLSLLARSLGMEPPYEAALKIASRNRVNNANRIEVGDRICLSELDKKEENSTAPSPEPSKDENNMFGIFVTPFLSFGKIDTIDLNTGARGSVTSKTNYGLELRFMQFWADSFVSEIIAVLEQREYKTRSSRTFDENGGFISNFGVGFGYRPLERMDLKVKAMYGDEQYFRAPSPSSLAIDKTKAFKMDLGVYYDVFRSASRKYTAEIGAGIRLLTGEHVDSSANTSYKANFGYGYFGAFAVRQNFESFMLEEAFVYEDIRKDTDLFDQTLATMYLKMGILFPF